MAAAALLVAAKVAVESRQCPSIRQVAPVSDIPDMSNRGLPDRYLNHTHTHTHTAAFYNLGIGSQLTVTWAHAAG